MGQCIGKCLLYRGVLIFRVSFIRGSTVLNYTLCVKYSYTNLWIVSSSSNTVRIDESTLSLLTGVVGNNVCMHVVCCG